MSNYGSMSNYASFIHAADVDAVVGVRAERHVQLADALAEALALHVDELGVTAQPRGSLRGAARRPSELSDHL